MVSELSRATIIVSHTSVFIIHRTLLKLEPVLVRKNEREKIRDSRCEIEREGERE